MEAGALPVPPRSKRMTSTEFPLPAKVTEKEDRGPTRSTPSEVCAYSCLAEISRPYVHVAKRFFSSIYLHYSIIGYPAAVRLVCSKNDYKTNCTFLGV